MRDADHGNVACGLCCMNNGAALFAPVSVIWACSAAAGLIRHYHHDGSLSFRRNAARPPATQPYVSEPFHHK